MLRLRPVLSGSHYFRGWGWGDTPGVSLLSNNHQICHGAHGGLVISALDLRSGGRWFEPGLCRRVVSLDKTEALFHIVSLHPGV